MSAARHGLAYSEKCFHHQLDSHWVGGIKPEQLMWQQTWHMTQAATFFCSIINVVCCVMPESPPWPYHCHEGTREWSGTGCFFSCANIANQQNGLPNCSNPSCTACPVETRHVQLQQACKQRSKPCEGYLTDDLLHSFLSKNYLKS